MLRAELDARAERTRIAADRIVLELARVAFSDIARIADWREDTGWRLRPPDELGDADRAAIARVRLRERDVQIVLHDKIRALDTLGKYFKLWGKHADKFPPRPGIGEDPATLRNRARAALATQARALLDAKDAERARKLAEEEEWAAAWRAAFG